LIKDRDYIVGLDIGTTKIATVIAREGSIGNIEIKGVGTSRSSGLKNGIVVNMDETTESIKRAMEEAERIAGVQPNEVIVGISGGHIKTIESTGIVAVTGDDNVIQKSDVDRVIAQAESISLPSDREIIHTISREFIVDHQVRTSNPVGMFGKKLEAKVNIVTAALNSAKNIIKCVEKAGYRVCDIVLQSLASSYAILESDEKEMGVVLVDMGGGTTDLAVFSNGTLSGTSIIGLGGENITSDLSRGLKTSKNVAEEIKLKYGVASSKLLKDKNFLVPVRGAAGWKEKQVSIQIVTNIIEMCTREILEFAYNELKRNFNTEMISSGVVLTGGTAKLKGIQEVTEEMFNLPVKVGSPEKGIEGLRDIVQDPAFSTSVGLVKYGIEHKGEVSSTKVAGERFFQRILERMKKWFNEQF